MTPTERRLLTINACVGAGLTVLMVIVTAAGGLDAMERWLYDRRARDNQRFTPPPTDELVHVDIDDGSLESIGRWPWDRSVMARIIDELDRAGAKAIGLDIIFSEPQAVVGRRDGQGNWVEIDHDAEFAEAIKKQGKVIIPVSLKPVDREDELYDATVEALLPKLDQEIDEVADKLEASGILQDRKLFSRSVFYPARRRAFYLRILDRLASDPDISVMQLQREFLPDFDIHTEGRVQQIILAEQYQKARGFFAVRQYGRPAPVEDLVLPASTPELPPIPVLAQHITATAFVDYIPEADGTVRSVPLWMEYNGRLYPKLGFALACAHLGIDPSNPKQVLVEADAVTLVHPTQGWRRRLPVHEAYMSRLNRRVGCLMHLPWFGPTDVWQEMYGQTKQGDIKGHMPAAFVYEIAVFRDKVKQNCALIDLAVADALAPLMTQDELAAFRKRQRPPLDNVEARYSEIDQVIKQLKEALLYDEFISVPDDPAAIQAFFKEIGIDGTDRDSLAARQSFVAVRTFALIQTEIDSLLEQIASKEKELREKVEGKSILVGSTATGTVDIVTTSIHNECPGVLAHGALFNAILIDDTWTPTPVWVTLFITLFIGLLTAAASAWLSPSRALPTAGLLGLGYFLANGILLFDYANLIVGTAGPISAVAVVWSGCTLTRFIAERRERARVTRSFQSYVDPALVSYVLNNPKQARLDGQLRELTVVFTDLAGFTSLSEKLGEDTVPLLNDYMSLMVPAIRKQNGYVNKFLGDGIMFFYGAPLANERHAVSAVYTVLEMQKLVDQFNQTLNERGLPRVQMRAGIASGHMVVGDAGSIHADDRGDVASDYTVLGDTVNLGARLESANKATGTLIMLNDRNAELVRDTFLLRPIAKLQVVGKTEGIMAWEPLAPLEEATDEQRHVAELWHGVVDAFVAGEFQESLDAIDAMDMDVGVTRLTELYRRLNLQYITDPPGESFDGSIVLESK